MFSGTSAGLVARQVFSPSGLALAGDSRKEQLVTSGHDIGASEVDVSI